PAKTAHRVESGPSGIMLTYRNVKGRKQMHFPVNFAQPRNHKLCLYAKLRPEGGISGRRPDLAKAARSRSARVGAARGPGPASEDATHHQPGSHPMAVVESTNELKKLPL